MLSDLQFAVDFATQAGQRMLAMRQGVGVSTKLDCTVVSEADTTINRDFIDAVRHRSGGGDSVRGEEASALHGQRRVWIIDPIDGTGEYVDPTVPMARRTSCVGIALILSGVLKLAVVHNPFRRETFTAKDGAAALLNGRPIACSGLRARAGAPYDYSHWNGARFDLRRLERPLGPPQGIYSAIYQACMVATGHSTFAAFPGDTIHDIAPGALLVRRAGGVVTDFFGNPLDWTDLGRGVLYANTPSHSSVVKILRSI